jgi:hypothetical protein
MFHGWDSFYLLTGGAGGAIIGLLFVVATLMRGDDPDSLLRATATYMTPIVFHLAMVLGVSAFTAAPGLAPEHQGAVLGACAVIGLVISYRVVHRLGVARTVTPAHWSDIWWYGYAAFAAYVALLAGAAAVWMAPTVAADLVGAGLLALLLVAIRNAWDLVTWISIKMRVPLANETAKPDAARKSRP